jgi:hypothetical protein
MTIQEWMSFVIGRNVDYDGAFGAQCVDLARDYLGLCLGVKKADQPEATEGAAQWWSDFERHPKARAVLRKVPAGERARQGDLAVWPPKPGNKYGHIAVVIGGGVNGGRVAVVEQDGLNQGRGAEVAMRDSPPPGGGLLRPV